MTVIEFFDHNPLENMLCCLAHQPDEIIFVGDKKMMREEEGKMDRFLGYMENYDTRLRFAPVNKSSLSDIISTLLEIIEERDNCILDITGGDDLSLVAAGIVYERKAWKGVTLCRCNVRTGRLYQCDPQGQKEVGIVPGISVEENIILHGGVVVTDEDKPDGTYIWDFNEEFVADIDTMWRICRRNCTEWNSQFTKLDVASVLCEPSEDPLFYRINTERADDYLKKMHQNGFRVYSLMRDLERAGIIHRIREEKDYYSFCFKNDQIKRCLSRAGTILELKTYLAGMQAQDADGNDVFNDGLMGVTIDWDGVIHYAGDGEIDTINEIDVILMKGVIPYFISCKNGAVEEDELYKLKTVAERFGGSYAVKVLVATSIGKEENSVRYFKQRAKDMGILVISDVHEMSGPEFLKAITRLGADY